MLNADRPTWPTVPIREEVPPHFSSEEIDPNDLPGGDSNRWPFVVAPQPGVPVVPSLGDLVRTLVCLIWLEPDRVTGQDTQDSCGPRDPDTGGRGGVTWQAHCGFVQSF